MLSLAQKLFGSSNDRQLKRLQAKIVKINEIEAEWEKLSDADIKAKTNEFRERLKGDEDLDDIMAEA